MLLQRLATGTTGVKQARYRQVWRVFSAVTIYICCSELNLDIDSLHILNDVVWWIYMNVSHSIEFSCS